jgi:hypothetical protein
VPCYTVELVRREGTRQLVWPHGVELPLEPLQTSKGICTSWERVVDPQSHQKLVRFSV